MLTLLRRYLKHRYDAKVRAALAVLFPHGVKPLPDNEQQRCAMEYINEFFHDAYAALN